MFTYRQVDSWPHVANTHIHKIPFKFTWPSMTLWLWTVFQFLLCGYRDKNLSRALWNPLCRQEPTISICHLRHRFAGRWRHICGTCHLTFCHSERSTPPLSTLPFSETYPFHFRIGVGQGQSPGSLPATNCAPHTPTSDLSPHFRHSLPSCTDFFLALWHILSNIWFLANQDYLSFKAISFRSNIQNFKSQECYWCV